MVNLDSGIARRVRSIEHVDVGSLNAVVTCLSFLGANLNVLSTGQNPQGVDARLERCFASGQGNFHISGKRSAVETTHVDGAWLVAWVHQRREWTLLDERKETAFGNRLYHGTTIQ